VEVQAENPADDVACEDGLEDLVLGPFDVELQGGR
jgi:hypothetical protein